jgi:hypothetical protein
VAYIQVPAVRCSGSGLEGLRKNTEILVGLASRNIVDYRCHAVQGAYTGVVGSNPDWEFMDFCRLLEAYDGPISAQGHLPNVSEFIPNLNSPKDRPLVPVLRQMNPVQTLTPHFSNTHFNALPSTPRSPK